MKEKDGDNIWDAINRVYPLTMENPAILPEYQKQWTYRNGGYPVLFII